MTSLNKWDTTKFDNMLKRLETLCKKEMDWGFFEDAVYPQDHNNKAAAGKQVAQVAFWNENGSLLAPPRPFFTASISRIVAIPGSNQPWKCAKQVADVITTTMWNGRNRQAIQALGKTLQEDLQDKIVSYGMDAGDENPKNSPRWAAKKGHDQPLVESGIMFDSVEYRMRPAGSV